MIVKPRSPCGSATHTNLVELPPDPRAAGVRALRHFMELPGDDAEELAERRLLRRLDLKAAIRRD